MSPRKYIKHLMILVGLALGLAVAPPAAAAQEVQCEDAQLIVVHGAGEVRTRPDSLSVSVGVEARAATLEQARTQASTIMRQVIDALRALDVPRLTLETRVLQVKPVYAARRNEEPPAIVGYTASNHVTVTLRTAPVEELGDLGSRVLDTALAAGANSIGGLSFFLADPSQAQDEALTQAVQNAAHDADVIARAAGVTVAGLHSVEESSGMHLVPRAAVLEAGASTPLAVDDVIIQSSVTAKFSFR